MNRRGFLKASAAAALAIASAPGFIRRAFADESCAPKSTAGLAALAGAYRRAQRDGRPLLVLVIPEDREAQWDRGAAWGELLNYGSDEQLAPLSLVEIACARMSELEKLAPQARGGEPMAIVLETARVPAQVSRIDAALPQYDGDRFSRRDWDEMERLEARISSARIEVLARALRERLAPGGLTGDPAALASDVRARVTSKPPAGARWARSSGCGTVVEGENDDSVFGCGMGHVPAQSVRFLTFYSRGLGR
ncbi:MAG TPA: twin-arginine translocation signal domain-containing protein [Polyangia bacterium]|nr:twin-arginine translocation signal domain-containing protein [Polyangia bacterium]